MAESFFTMRVKTQTRGDVFFKDILREFTELKTLEARVGIVDPQRTYPGQTATLGEVALWNEFGTHTKTGKQIVPARSFLRTPTDMAMPEINKRLGLLLGQIVDGKSNPRNALRVIGSFLVNKMRQTIKSRISPALAPYTLKRRREEGITGTVPLYATHFLYDNINFKVGNIAEEG